MGKKYLYPAPPLSVAIFYGGQGGLVLAEEVFLQADISKGRHLYIEELPVLDAPRDGLGELPNP